MNYKWKDFLDKLCQGNTFAHLFQMIKEHEDLVESEICDVNGYILKRTFSEFVDAVENVCGNIQKSWTYEKDSIIGLSMNTTQDWPVLFWGILMSGYIPILLNPDSNDEHKKELLNEAKAVAYISSNRIKESEMPFLEASIVLSNNGKGIEKWADYIALCTSGTTGESRIFLYSGEAIIQQLISFDDAHRVNEDIPFSDEIACKVLAFLPFHHVFGLISVSILYACSGKTVVYLRNKNLKEIFETCQKHEVSHLFAVPLFFNSLAKFITEDNPYPLGRKIRYMISGGGFLPETTLRKINEAGYPLYNGFGMTECGILTVEISKSLETRIQGGLGKPFSITEFKTEPKNVGELFIRGKGLYSSSIIGGKIVSRDTSKWFKTGDIVRITKDNMFFCGRAKDIIINSNGENIYPDELETSFVGIPGVDHYCVVGVKKDLYEEICLVIENNDKVDEQSIIKRVSFYNENHSLGEQITRVLLFNETLPISDNGKVKRIMLKERIENNSGKFQECNILELSKQIGTKKGAVAMNEKDEIVEIKNKIRSIIAKSLSIKKESIKDDDDFVRDLSGDSLTLIYAVNQIEECFNVVISDEEIHKMSNINISSEIIRSKLRGEKCFAGEQTIMPIEGHRITAFNQSEQYKSLQKRIQETFPDGKSPFMIPHESLISDTSIVFGKEVINLGSNNYLGMSGNPEVTEAAIEALSKYGTSASGSRTLSSEKTLYRKLEKQLAQWKHTDDAIVCSGGWAENLSFMSCFMVEGDLILYDSLSHNSIMQGIALSKAESKAFIHNDRKMLEDILQHIEGKYNKVLIFVEGVYSMDGDIAPIPDFVRLKKQYHCFLMVDEAHALGVIGENGGGVDEYYGLEPTDIDIKFGTLSKALGCCGGYIAAEHSIIEYLRYNMGAYVYSTGISPALAGGVMKAIEILHKDNSLVKKLHDNIAYFVRRCHEEGMNICLAKESGIIPVFIGKDDDAAILSSKLLENGIFVPPSMYPAVPMGGSRIRFTISATHSFEQLEKAVTTMARLMREIGLLKTV